MQSLFDSKELEALFDAYFELIGHGFDSGWQSISPEGGRPKLKAKTDAYA